MDHNGKAANSASRSTTTSGRAKEQLYDLLQMALFSGHVEAAPHAKKQRTPQCKRAACLPLPRYLFCLSNWLIMLRLEPSHRPPVKAGLRASNRSEWWNKQLFCSPCPQSSMVGSHPSSRPVHAGENMDWERKDFRIHLHTVSFIRFLLLIVVHCQPADR